MEAGKGRGNIVLTKQNIDGQDYIRIDYASNQAVALLFSEDSDIQVAGDGSAYMQASAFRLPAFYDRYSPHAYIDYSRVYVRHPKPKRKYVLSRELLNLTPKDIVSERMLIRIMGKGKKCRYSLLSEKVLGELRAYYKEYRPQKWLFEGDTPGGQ